MYLVVRKVPNRCVTQRYHANNFVVRSLDLSQRFGQYCKDIRCVSSLQGPSDSSSSNDDSDSSCNTLSRPDKRSNFDKLNYLSLETRRQYILSGNNSTANPFVRNKKYPNTSQDATLNLLRSTLGSRAASRILIFDPLHSCFGLSPKAYQLDARMFLSSGVGRRSGTDAKIPTPKSPAQNSIFSFASFDPMKILKRVFELTLSMTKIFVMFLFKLPGNTIYYLINPKERRERTSQIRDLVKKELDHYWTGSKLLMADVRTARSLLARTLQGSTLTRRERKQLLRTVTDLFRLVPFSMFILIPFMEFALPFALRLFPNMLPSTFQDSLKSEQNMKRELKSRIAMAQFFQETLQDLAKEQKRIARKRNTETPDDKIASKQIESAASMLEFLNRARTGEMMPPEVIVQYATHFQDDLTLDNMPRMQLINMCKYMAIPPYGSDNFLRFQLRHKIKTLKEDDQRILWEGIDSLTKMELREACQERGMRSTGLSKEAYRRSLQQWLDLSVNMNVPISLLIMSRTFFLQEESVTPASGDEAKSVAGLADAISGLDKEVLNEVILEVATSEEKKSDPDVRKIKLEVLSHQNEKIREEQAERESAAKKKETAESLEAEKSEAQSQESASEPPKAQDIPREQKKEAESEDAPEYSVTEKFFDDRNDMVEINTKEQEEQIESPVEEEKCDSDLSADEIEALEELVSADPVKKEKEDLERIKSAMKKSSDGEEIEEDEEQEKNAIEDTIGSVVDKSEAVFQSAEIYVTSVVEESEKKAFSEAEKLTVFSTESSGRENNTKGQEQEPSSIVDEEGINKLEETDKEQEEDVVVAALKNRIEKMVDKIEVQLSDAQMKIGDKLHFLDKDMDGILSREEIVESLQQVLKREITIEEAEEIFSEMDEDGDGVLSVQELITWIDTNKLVKLESEGRDADMDRIMENQRAGNQKEEQASDDSDDQKGEKVSERAK